MLKNVKSISTSIAYSNQVMKQVMERSMQRKPFSGHTSTVMLALKTQNAAAYSSVPSAGSVITCSFLINISLKKPNRPLVLLFNSPFMNSNLGKVTILKHAGGVLMYKMVCS